MRESLREMPTLPGDAAIRAKPTIKAARLWR
jgi:hypothetical protein